MCSRFEINSAAFPQDMHSMGKVTSTLRLGQPHFPFELLTFHISLFNLAPSQDSIMAHLSLKTLSALQVSRHQISKHQLIPNTTIQNKPLLIYHSCIPSSASASNIESHLKSVGVVTPQWRYTMYSTTHFHSTAHEVLCISSGRAKLCMPLLLVCNL